MFVSRRVYLIVTKTDRIDRNKGNNVFVFALAFPSLNCLRTHSERTRVLCPSMLMWCSSHITCGNHEINVCALRAKFLCSCVQTNEFLKNTRVELQKIRVLPSCVFKV